MPDHFTLVAVPVRLQQGIPQFPADGQRSIKEISFKNVNETFSRCRLLHEWNQVLCKPRDNLTREILELTRHGQIQTTRREIPRVLIVPNPARVNLMNCIPLSLFQ